jgi:hypothetical protein
MTGESIIKCQWGRCSETATNHVRFGNRTFGTEDILPSPVQNFTVLHRNLCRKHVDVVRTQYLEVTVFDIGDCHACGK